MRVVSGFLGGRNFAAPRAHKSKPVSQKMLAAAFSVLGDISGSIVLDGFAGSGAFAIESISRGASNAVLIDSDQSAVKTINQNVSDLGIKNKVKVTKAPLKSWLNNNEQTKFDLIFLDPPPDNLQISTVMATAKFLAGRGVLALVWPCNQEDLNIDGLSLVYNKNYGESKLLLFKTVDTG